MVEIRKVKESDLDDLYLLNKEDLGYDYPKDKMKEKIKKTINRQSEVLYVAVDEGKVVGYIHACDYDVIYMDHLKNILGIAVSSDYRHRGIGKMLLDEVEQWGHETGASGIRLVSGESRTDAHEFYKRCGYIFKKKQLNFIKLFNH